MIPSALFVDRPGGASVISVLLTNCRLLSLLSMPIRAGSRYRSALAQVSSPTSDPGAMPSVGRAPVASRSKRIRRRRHMIYMK